MGRKCTFESVGQG